MLFLTLKKMQMYYLNEYKKSTYTNRILKINPKKKLDKKSM